jgi:hypothetical protein
LKGINTTGQDSFITVERQITVLQNWDFTERLQNSEQFVTAS